MVIYRQREQATGLALVDSASVARIAIVGVGVGVGGTFGSDIAAAAINTSQHRLESLSPSLHSFHSWLDESGGPSTDLDTMPMSRSVYGDYLAATLAKAIDRLRDQGVRK